MHNLARCDLNTSVYIYIYDNPPMIYLETFYMEITMFFAYKG